MASPDKFAMQDEQSTFPYHWLPRKHPDGSFVLGQTLSWGLEYLTYMDYLATQICDADPASVLDVGCGDGRLLDLLTEKNPAIKNRYTGIDPSERAIQFARALNGHDRFHCSTGAEITEQFSAVLLVEVLEHVPDEAVDTFLSKAKSWLAPGGTLWISVPSNNTPVIAKHYRHYSVALAEETLNSNGLGIVDVAYLCKTSPLVDLLRRAVTNRVYTLTNPWITRRVWKLHESVGYFAEATTCRHLVVRAVVR